MPAMRTGLAATRQFRAPSVGPRADSEALTIGRSTPTRSGGLTESGREGMIQDVTRRGVRPVELECSPVDAPGQVPIHSLRLPTPSRPMSEPNKSWPSCRVVAQRAPADRASQKEQKNSHHDDSHHHRVGGRPVRRDAPHAPPGLLRHPTLLQHERLHQLPRRRSRHERGHLPGLRLHAPHALIASGGRLNGCRTSDRCDRFARRDRPARLAQLTHPRRR
jgi:hypothetical protein